MRNLFIIVVAVVNFLTLTCALNDALASTTFEEMEATCNHLPQLEEVLNQNREHLMANQEFLDEDLLTVVKAEMAEANHKMGLLKAECQKFESDPKGYNFKDFEWPGSTIEIENEDSTDMFKKNCVEVEVTAMCSWWDVTCNDDISLRWYSENHSDIYVGYDRGPVHSMLEDLTFNSIKSNTTFICGTGEVAIFEEDIFGGSSKVDSFKVVKKGGEFKITQTPNSSSYKIKLQSIK